LNLAVARQIQYHCYRWLFSLGGDILDQILLLKICGLSVLGVAWASGCVLARQMWRLASGGEAELELKIVRYLLQWESASESDISHTELPVPFRWVVFSGFASLMAGLIAVYLFLIEGFVQLLGSW
jgi:hypothetical protein